MKEAEQIKAQQKREDVLQLKPAIWGVGINLTSCGGGFDPDLRRHERGPAKG